MRVCGLVYLAAVASRIRQPFVKWVDFIVKTHMWQDRQWNMEPQWCGRPGSFVSKQSSFGMRLSGSRTTIVRRQFCVSKGVPKPDCVPSFISHLISLYTSLCVHYTLSTTLIKTIVTDGTLIKTLLQTAHCIRRRHKRITMQTTLFEMLRDILIWRAPRMSRTIYYNDTLCELRRDPSTASFDGWL
jgi:hypothetical protein